MKKLYLGKEKCLEVRRVLYLNQHVGKKAASRKKIKVGGTKNKRPKNISFDLKYNKTSVRILVSKTKII